MKKILLLVAVAVAVVIGIWLLSRPAVRSDPVADATSRIAKCVIRLNGQVATRFTFAMGDQIEISGEMQIVRPSDDLIPEYVAFLVALDHPKAKDIIADSGFLRAKVQDNFSTFKGHLKTPKRVGSYELRVFFMDSHEELQAMDPIRLFYRVPVTVS